LKSIPLKRVASPSLGQEAESSSVVGMEYREDFYVKNRISLDIIKTRITPGRGKGGGKGLSGEKRG